MDEDQPLNGATLRVIAASLGLHRSIDIAHLLDRNERTIKRWFTDERPIGPDVAETFREWQNRFSQAVNARLDTIDTLVTNGEEPIILTRYPNKAALRDSQQDQSILTYSAETWDAYLGRIVSTLEDQGVPYRVETHLG